jgi:hypothetical protein
MEIEEYVNEDVIESAFYWNNSSNFINKNVDNI